MTNDDFNPYTEWLDIPLDLQPADHYVLLGLPRFTSDTVAIEQAADARMAHLRTFQSGPRGRYTQNLLNQLAAAKLCLLNSSTKATYDNALQGMAAADQAPPPWQAPAEGERQFTTAPPPPEQPAPAALAVERPRVGLDAGATPVVSAVTRQPPRDDSLFTRPWFPAAAIGGVLAVVLIAWLTARALTTASAPEDNGPPPPPTPVQPQPEEQPETEVIIIEQEGSGEIHFPASAAIIHEGAATRESVAGDLALNHWRTTSGWVTWEFHVVRPGFFNIHVTYAAESQIAGGRYGVAIENRTKRTSVRDTGGPAMFITDEIGVLAVPRSGKHTLRLQPLEIPAADLMALRSIRLEPVE